MTRKLFFLALPFFLFIFVAIVNAQDTATSSPQTKTNPGTKLKQQIQFLQEQKKAAVEKIRDEFKTKIQTIKDQRKKNLLERIDAKISRINKKTTDRFQEILVRLQNFLDKTSQSTKDEKILASVKIAQDAIDKASSAVASQAEKVYTANITDEASLRLNVGTTVSQFRQDLTGVHKTVVDAKQAVQKLRANNAINQ